MPGFVRRPFSALIVFCSLACVSLPAGANSVKVSGTAYQGNESNALSVTAGIFSTFSAAPDGPSYLGVGTAGVPLTLFFRVLPWSGPDNAQVNIGSKFTDILQGEGILFTGTFTVPMSAISKGTFTGPVSMSGQLAAFQDLTLGQGSVTPGPLMANLLFNGTGMATLQLNDVGGGQFVVQFATVNFNGRGSLTVVPEPGSLFLLSTGLAGFGTMCWRRILFRSPA